MKHRYVILVCGGRGYANRHNVNTTLDLVHGDSPISKLVQGYARGADRLAHEWALSRGVRSTGQRYQVTNKMWQEQGRKAGYLRNKLMRDEEQPDVIIAFPGNAGTQMMIDLAHEAGILVLIVDDNGVIT